MTIGQLAQLRRTAGIASLRDASAFAALKRHRKSRVGAVYIAIGAFRDWVVGDSYGQISDEWGKISNSDE